MSGEDERSVASAHWDNIRPDALPRRFWQSADIITSINRRMGSPSSIWSGALIEAVKEALEGKPLRRGIAIGCGAGGKELQLMKAGIVETFELFEISQNRVAQGRALFEQAGFADRVVFRSDDGLSALANTNTFDFIHWDNALHHMSDTRDTLSMSLNALRGRGYMMINEYVGPNRFQFSDEDLRYVTALRALLPDRFFLRSAGARLEVSRVVSRPTVSQMLALDPSEASDSEAILPAVRSLLPTAKIWPLGGVIYHLGLNDVLANFRMPDDDPILSLAMMVDEALSLAGHNHYAACLFRNRA